MAKNPILPLYYNDLLGATKTWTDEEFGAYVRLLIEQWDKGGLPNDYQRLTRIATSLSTTWPMLSEKFPESGGLLKNPVMESIREKRAKHSEKQSENVRKRYQSTYQKPTKNLPLENEYENENEKSINSFGKFENLFFGPVPDDLIELAGRLEVRETAAEWHDHAEDEIRKLGYFTTREVPVEFDGGTGRIDLVANKPGICVAIELDYRTPRKKSIAKVQTYAIGMVLLRDPKIIKKTQQENDITARLDAALVDLYLEPLAMKAPTLYPGVDFNLEVARFRQKVTGSPRVYAEHDTGGLRLALEHQLRNARPSLPTGKLKPDIKRFLADA